MWWLSRPRWEGLRSEVIIQVVLFPEFPKDGQCSTAGPNQWRLLKAKSTSYVHLAVWVSISLDSSGTPPRASPTYTLELTRETKQNIEVPITLAIMVDVAVSKKNNLKQFY